MCSCMHDPYVATAVVYASAAVHCCVVFALFTVCVAGAL